MAAESLFTSQVPVTADASDGAPGISTSTRLVFALPGFITHVRFYGTVTVSGTYVVEVWQMDTADSEPSPSGTLLASKTLDAPPVTGWNEIELDTPVPVDTAHVYISAVWSGAGRYVASTGLFSAADLVNGNITAPQNGTNVLTMGVRNGGFVINAANGHYPDTGGNGTSYFADVVYEATVPPAEGSAEFGLDLALATVGERSPAGEAAFGLAYAVATAGERPPVPANEGDSENLQLQLQLGATGLTPTPDENSGSAAFGLALAVATTGDAPTPGQNTGLAAFGFVFTLATTGDAPTPGESAGSAALGIIFTVATTGDNGGGPMTRCRPVRSFKEVLPV